VNKLKLNRKHVTERNALHHLTGRQRYLVRGVKKLDDRYACMFKAVGGKLEYTDGVVCVLTVPQTSYLGKILIKMYDAKDKAPKKRKTARRG
jgi:hypothetical protein